METLKGVIARPARASVEGLIIPAGLVMVKGAGNLRTGAETAEALLLDREQGEKLMGLAFRRFGIRRADAQEVLAETLLELSASDALVGNPKGFAFRVFYFRCCRWLEREGHSRVETAGSSAYVVDVTSPDVCELGLTVVTQSL
jgi:DNA-directed RNA polymerase specialized sigma24 family protein